MAYNEASNIANAISSILRQSYGVCDLHEIIVVASGCTDRTLPIIQEYAAQDPRIRLIAQEKREGKTSAMHLFLQKAREEVCVWESANRPWAYVACRRAKSFSKIWKFQQPWP